jgi:hypothetical protein
MRVFVIAVAFAALFSVVGELVLSQVQETVTTAFSSSGSVRL